MSEIVAHVVQHLRPGGLETLALDLVRHAPAGQEAHLICLDGLDLEPETWPKLAGLTDRIHTLDKKPGLTPTTVWRLRRLLRALKCQRVITHHIGPMIYGGVAARLAGCQRLVHVEHDAWHLANQNEKRWASWICRFARPTIVAVSPTVATGFAEHLPWMPTTTIFNGIDTESFAVGDKGGARAALGLPDERRIIGCAARLEAVKGHEVLISALSRMEPGPILALAGDGSRADALRSLAADLGVADRVVFLGQVDDMPTFYQALDVFALASHNEGLPLAALEAQASGIAVVLTDVGGTRDGVCPVTGKLVPPTDPDALSLALSLQIQGQTDRQTAEQTRAFVRDRFDIRAAAGAYGRLVA